MSSAEPPGTMRSGCHKRHRVIPCLQTVDSEPRGGLQHARRYTPDIRPRTSAYPWVGGGNAKAKLARGIQPFTLHFSPCTVFLFLALHAMSHFRAHSHSSTFAVLYSYTFFSSHPLTCAGVPGNAAAAGLCRNRFRSACAQRSGHAAVSARLDLLRTSRDSRGVDDRIQ
jgi:hypothetical protein